jgi:hypothetical protein
MLFYVAVSAVTILTYLRAKKTLLQPIRTEIFKAQLQEFTQLLSLFKGKGEAELRNEWGFDDLIDYNSMALLDAFGVTFFDVRVDLRERPYGPTNCPQFMTTPERVRLVEDPFIEVPTKVENDNRDGRVRAAVWTRYTYDTIHLPCKLLDAQDRLMKILESPLLPKKCVELIGQYRTLIDNNVGYIRNTLTDVSAELPEKYGSLEALRKASNLWIRNLYNDRFEPLKPKADQIVQFIREYYDIESILH